VAWAPVRLGLNLAGPFCRSTLPSRSLTRRLDTAAQDDSLFIAPEPLLRFVECDFDICAAKLSVALRRQRMAGLERLHLAWIFNGAGFTINGAIARATNSGVEFYLPELLRIKSQILAARHDRESAMNCLTEALAVCTHVMRSLVNYRSDRAPVAVTQSGSPMVATDRFWRAKQPFN
jgi:hypothetical protein